MTAKLELSQVFHCDPEIMGGIPVFTGTRVPVRNFIDYLEGCGNTFVLSLGLLFLRDRGSHQYLASPLA